MPVHPLHDPYRMKSDSRTAMPGALSSPTTAPAPTATPLRSMAQPTLSMPASNVPKEDYVNLHPLQSPTGVLRGGPIPTLATSLPHALSTPHAATKKPTPSTTPPTTHTSVHPSYEGLFDFDTESMSDGSVGTRGGNGVYAPSMGTGSAGDYVNAEALGPARPRAATVGAPATTSSPQVFTFPLSTSSVNNTSLTPQQQQHRLTQQQQQEPSLETLNPFEYV